MGALTALVYYEKAALAPEAWSHGVRFVGGDLLVNMAYAGNAEQGVVKIVGVFTGDAHPPSGLAHLGNLSFASLPGMRDTKLLMEVVELYPADTTVSTVFSEAAYVTQRKRVTAGEIVIVSMHPGISAGLGVRAASRPDEAFLTYEPLSSATQAL